MGLHSPGLVYVQRTGQDSVVDTEVTSVVWLESLRILGLTGSGGAAEWLVGRPCKPLKATPQQAAMAGQLPASESLFIHHFLS